VGWQSLLLCRCVSDNINVVGALQSAHLGSKPNLDVLGVMIHESLMFIYKLLYFYFNHLVSLFLFTFFWSCTGCSICGYLFSHSSVFFFQKLHIIWVLGMVSKIEWMRQRECSMNDISLSQVCCWCIQLIIFIKKMALGQVTTFFFWFYCLSS